MAEIDDTYAEAFRSIFAEVLITARDRVWICTGREIAEHWLRVHPG